MQAAHEEIAALLASTRDSDPAGREMTEAVLEAVEVVGRSNQAHEGELILLLAEAERHAPRRRGLVPWLSTHLDLSEGAARGLAKSAKKIGHLPELTETLSSGTIGADTMRNLTRTACAVARTEQDLTTALTQTLEISRTEGVGAAKRHVQILEETVDPGRAEKLLNKQRQRSFLRFAECESGMVRLEALLDPERATIVQAAVELTVAAALRARQFDKTEIVPEDVRSVEQLQAHALVRFAEVFLDASPEQRGAHFTAPAIYSAKLDPTEDARLAETIHGRMIPRTRLAPLGNPATHLIEHTDDQPVRLDGENLDQNPTARLATPKQRIALAWRDKFCTYPGCSRPPTWALHAHHKIPYGPEGPTIMGNLKLLCAEHHVLTHHPGHVAERPPAESRSPR